MKRTVTTVFSSAQVIDVLANHVLETRGVDYEPGTKLSAEFMAIAERDANDKVVFNQYRLELTLESPRDS